MASQESSPRLPVLPLRDAVVHPWVVTPLLIGRAASLAAVEAATAGDGRLLLVAQRNPEVDEPTAGDLHRVGVVARVQQVARPASGTLKILVEAGERVRVTRYAAQGRMLRAAVAPFPLEAPTGDAVAEAEAVGRRALSLFEEYAGLQRRIPPEVVAALQELGDGERRAWGIAAHLTLRQDLRQELLEAPSLAALAQRLADVLASEVELLRLERSIDDRVRGTIFQNQREFWLNEQLKAIHRELGNDDGDDVGEMEAQLKARRLPAAVETRALREVRRLRRMSPMSPESTVARTFLDWVLALPWHERADAAADVARAREVLDEDHHGLEDVKDRVLDHLAVLSLVGEARGPVLCLVGPPGVGKTSLARSVARALGRKFVRISLGGVRDEAEIRGHRRTYIGAMPGRIVQAMRKAEVVNPVLLLDEIDKMGSDWRGDPASALLEVLDPEQNAAFNDHFLEVDYDLSRVLFLATANSLAQIPEPLRDRMEVIRIPGYLEQEKLAIARRFLVPRQLKQAGLDPDAVAWDEGTLEAIVRGWTREAGVRDLERRVARVARKLARRVLDTAPAAPSAPPFAVSSPAGIALRNAPPRPAPGPQSVTVADLPSLLGPAPFDAEDLALEDKVGVANGLAYTPVGGEMLEVEVSVVPGRGRLQLTGTLGDVMKESANAALSYVRARAAALGVDPEFHRTRDIHIHIPAGATPKDGPSAGITIATALVSALTGIPVRGDVAMTGEITLRGRVLPIGGLKEKSVAAHRHRVRHVVLPHANARTVAELPEDVRTGLAWHPVESMDAVLAVALRRPEAAGADETAKPPRTARTRRVRIAPEAAAPVPVPPAEAPAVSAAPDASSARASS